MLALVLTAGNLPGTQTSSFPVSVVTVSVVTVSVVTVSVVTVSVVLPPPSARRCPTRNLVRRLLTR
jgi:hypothetical protein